METREKFLEDIDAYHKQCGFPSRDPAAPIRVEITVQQGNGTLAAQAVEFEEWPSSKTMDTAVRETWHVIHQVLEISGAIQ